MQNINTALKYVCMFVCKYYIYIPLQVDPSISSRKPILHSQMKLPLVFVHIWEQLCVKLLHSSISSWKKRNCLHECMRVNACVCMYVCILCMNACIYIYKCM